MQSSNVVRGSIRRRWFLPLMRSVIETAPCATAGEPLDAAVLSASADAHPATTAVAAVLPMVLRKCRRVGFDAPDCSWSSGFLFLFMSPLPQLSILVPIVL